MRHLYAHVPRKIMEVFAAHYTSLVSAAAPCVDNLVDSDLRRVIGELESKVIELQRVCDERLQVIGDLDRAARERLEIIRQMDAALKVGQTA